MDEYSGFGSGLVILRPAGQVLNVSPKGGPGDRKGKKKRHANKKIEDDAKGLSLVKHKTLPGDDKEVKHGKGTGIDIVI